MLQVTVVAVSVLLQQRDHLAALATTTCGCCAQLPEWRLHCVVCTELAANEAPEVFGEPQQTRKRSILAEKPPEDCLSGLQLAHASGAANYVVTPVFPLSPHWRLHLASCWLGGQL